jgi:hypothetical protein
MNESDLVRLRHMLEAAQTALSFTENEARESLDIDLKLVSGSGLEYSNH